MDPYNMGPFDDGSDWPFGLPAFETVEDFLPLTLADPFLSTANGGYCMTSSQSTLAPGSSSYVAQSNFGEISGMPVNLEPVIDECHRNTAPSAELVDGFASHHDNISNILSGLTTGSESQPASQKDFWLPTISEPFPRPKPTGPVPKPTEPVPKPTEPAPLPLPAPVDLLTLKKHTCERCGKGFTRKDNCTRHIKTIHLEDLTNEDSLDCPTCGKRQVRRSFERHLSHCGTKNVKKGSKILRTGRFQRPKPY